MTVIVREVLILEDQVQVQDLHTIRIATEEKHQKSRVQVAIKEAVENRQDQEATTNNSLIC